MLHQISPSILGQQPPQAQIVDDILHIFDPVFKSVAALSQGIVLQIEDLKPSVNVLDESADLQWSAVVS